MQAGAEAAEAPNPVFVREPREPHSCDSCLFGANAGSTTRAGLKRLFGGQAAKAVSVSFTKIFFYVPVAMLQCRVTCMYVGVCINATDSVAVLVRSLVLQCCSAVVLWW